MIREISHVGTVHPPGVGKFGNLFPATTAG